MSEWKEYKVSDIVEKICVGFVGQCQKYYCKENEGIPMIRTTNLTEHGISFNDLKYVTFKFHEKNKKSQLRHGDIVIARHGDNGKACMYLENKEANCLNVVIIRIDKKKVNPKFFLYQFNSPIIRQSISNIASGSVQAVINTKEIAQFEVPIPNIRTQDSIVDLLTSLDDKIDLLHRQNKTLEALAETLFRQWFVEEAKEGWEKKRLGNYIEIKHGFAFKGDHITTEETDKILLTPGNFKIGGGFNFNKCRYYNDTDFPSTYILEEGNLIVTMTDLSQEGDTLGYPAFVPSIKDKYILHNQRIGKVLFKENHANKNLFFYWLMRGVDYRHFVLGSATGTTVRHTSPSIICDYEFTMPNITKLEKFEGQIKMLQEKETFNHIQIRTLTRLRDTLLPKLMSGEVRVEI